MMKYFTVFFLALGLLVPTLIFAQNQEQRRDDKVVIGTSEVMCDVVVRDKKGRVVKDLKETDFEVYEDGVRQAVSSFRLVLREAATPNEGKSTSGPSPAVTPSGREPFSGISLIAMVFDSLSPNGRSLAHKAALTFVDESLKPDDLATVCAIDMSLHVLQPYTNNKELLRQGIDRAASLSVSPLQSGAAQARSLDERSAALDTQVSKLRASAAASRGAGMDAMGPAALEQALTEMNVRALQVFEMLERDQQGFAKTDALLAVINSLREVPGRKAILFFSEGLALPPDVRERFRAVINAANKANVTVYSVDAAGLRVQSGNAESAQEINALGRRRLRQQASGQADTSGRPMTMQLERNEDVLKLDPQSGLTDLSKDTGGFLISDTNDLTAGLRRVDEDMRAHYVLTYAPRNQSLDGRFRQISVRLARSGLDVQTRKGYLALPSTGGAAVLDYEAPALAALSASSRPASFPVRTMGFSFPETKRNGFAPVIVETPASSFTYTPAPDKKNFNADYTIVLLVKDKNHQVIRKISQHYTLNGPIGEIDAARRGTVLFYRQLQLDSGHYTVEAAAYDAPTGKVSVTSSDLDIAPADDSKLRLSSIVILQRAEKLGAEEQKLANPFHYGELLIYPNLGEAISKTTMKQLPFYFNAYIPQGSKAPPQFTIEVFQNEKPVARSESPLPAPDAAGRIQYVSAIPTDSFQPGLYELRISLSDGANRISKAARFTLAP